MSVPAQDAARLRRVLGGVALIYLAFVIYGSFVPWQWRALEWDAAVTRFWSMPYSPFGPGSRVDWGVNFMLFVPLGFAAVGAVAAGRRHAWLAVLVLAPLWTLLSGAIEFAQLWFPPRTTGLHDIVAESAGGVAGGLLWLVIGAAFTRHALAWAEGQRAARWGALLALYALGLVVFALMPMDLSASLADLYTKWREGRVNLLPFGYAYQSATDAVIDLAGDAAIWLPMGLLAAAARRASAVRIVLGVALFAALLEAAQLLVMSRHTDITDVLMAAIGAALGVWVARALGLAWQGGADAHGAAASAEGDATNALDGLPLRPALWALLALLYAAVLPAVFWFPYDFRFDPAFVRPRLEAFWSLPMSALFFGDELHAAAAILRKLMLAVPLGSLLAAAVRSLPPAWHRAAGWAAALFALAVAAGTDFGKVFVASRTADLTGTLLFTLGAALGAVAVAGGSRRRGLSAEGPAAGAGEARPAAVATSPAPAAPAASSARHWLQGAAVLAVLLWLVTHAPGAPYNVRELLRPGWGLVSVGLLAVSLTMIAAFGAAAERVMAGRPPGATLWRWPLLLIAWALACAELVIAAVPAEAVSDVVGSPVLGWPWRAEHWLRLAALIGLVAWLIFGGQLPWRARGGRGARLAAWALISSALLPLAYWVIVSQAATDNLTELIADDAGPGAAAWLAAALWWAGFVGGALAWLGRRAAAELRATAASGAARWGARAAVALLLAAVGVLVGYALVLAGTEAVLVKYGRAFSALQFLLGTDRAHPPGPAALLARFALAYGALLMLSAWSAWAWVARSGARPRMP